MIRKPARPRGLIPLHRDDVRDDPVALVAHRLHSRFPGEPVRTLEALAMAEANRLAARATGVRAQVPPAPREDRAYAACRRIARRALSGALEDPVGEATRYHRETASPLWARDLPPLAEIRGFLFYAG